jgi:hypothetical protein
MLQKMQSAVCVFLNAHTSVGTPPCVECAIINMSDKMSDESSGSDSDEEVPDLSVQDMEALMKHESELEANPNLYDTHVQVRCEERRVVRRAANRRRS